MRNDTVIDTARRRTRILACVAAFALAAAACGGNGDSAAPEPSAEATTTAALTQTPDGVLVPSDSLEPTSDPALVVPDVVGMDAAGDVLFDELAEFGVIWHFWDGPWDFPNQIMAQTPDPGTEVAQGSYVEIWVVPEDVDLPRVLESPLCAPSDWDALDRDGDGHADHCRDGDGNEWMLWEFDRQTLDGWLVEGLNVWLVPKTMPSNHPLSCVESGGCGDAYNLFSNVSPAEAAELFEVSLYDLLAANGGSLNQYWPNPEKEMFDCLKYDRRHYSTASSPTSMGTTATSYSSLTTESERRLAWHTTSICADGQRVVLVVSRRSSSRIMACTSLKMMERWCPLASPSPSPRRGRLPNTACRGAREVRDWGTTETGGCLPLPRSTRGDLRNG